MKLTGIGTVWQGLGLAFHENQKASMGWGLSGEAWVLRFQRSENTTGLRRVAVMNCEFVARHTVQVGDEVTFWSGLLMFVQVSFFFFLTAPSAFRLVTNFVQVSF